MRAEIERTGAEPGRRLRTSGRRAWGRYVAADAAGPRDFAVRSAVLRIVPDGDRTLLLFSVALARGGRRRWAVWTGGPIEIPLTGFRCTGPQLAPHAPAIDVRALESGGDRTRVLIEAAATVAPNAGFHLDAWFRIVVRSRAATPRMGFRNLLLVCASFASFWFLMVTAVRTGADRNRALIPLGMLGVLVLYGIPFFCWFRCPVCRRHIHVDDAGYHRGASWSRCLNCGAPV